MSRRGKHPFDSGLEVVELDGFDEMLGEAGLQTSFDVAVIAKPTDRNPRNNDCEYTDEQQPGKTSRLHGLNRLRLRHFDADATAVSLQSGR